MNLLRRGFICVTTILLPFVAASSLSQAEDWAFGGNTLTGVTVGQIEPDRVHITFYGGSAIIDIACLSPDLQKRFKYNPFMAMVAAKERAAQPGATNSPMGTVTTTVGDPNQSAIHSTVQTIPVQPPSTPSTTQPPQQTRIVTYRTTIQNIYPNVDGDALRKQLADVEAKISELQDDIDRQQNEVNYEATNGASHGAAHEKLAADEQKMEDLRRQKQRIMEQLNPPPNTTTTTTTSTNAPADTFNPGSINDSAGH